MNHTRPYEPADQRAGFDGLDRGDTVSLMREGVLCVVPEAAPSALDDSVYVRISGSGDVGVLTATADGGNTVDISDFARWLRLADGDGVAEVRVNLF